MANGSRQMKDAIDYAVNEVGRHGWREAVDKDSSLLIQLANTGYLVDELHAMRRFDLKRIVAGAFAGGAGVGSVLITLIHRFLLT